MKDEAGINDEVAKAFTDFLKVQVEKHDPYDVAMSVSLLCSALVESVTNEVISLVPILKKDKQSYIESQRAIVKLRGEG